MREGNPPPRFDQEGGGGPQIAFEKWSGAGNDFVLLRRAELPGQLAACDLAREICRRRRSVGADGLIVYDAQNARARLLNSDGSPAAFCGNGARCLGAYLLCGGVPGPVSFSLGEIDCQAWPLPQSGGETAVTVPAPRQVVGEIPREILARALGDHHGQLAAAALLEVGVPHLVLQFRGSPCWLLMDTEPVLRIGAALRRDPFFGPQGTNVSFLFAGLRGDRAAWRLRTYERGVEDETLACGTATVAAGALLLRRAGRTEAADAAVALQVASGERLRVERKGPAWILQGPAQRVFRGVFEMRGR